MDIYTKTVMLKGTSGTSIKNIEKTATNGNIDTYTIILTDGTRQNFNITNGIGIKGIAKTGTSGAIDTYTITLSDNSTFNFNVTNGTNIASVQKTATNNNVDTYTITLTDGKTSTFTVTNGTSVKSVQKTASSNGIDTYTITMSDGSTFPFNVSNAVASVPSAKFSYAYTNGIIAETDTALEAGLYLIVYRFNTYSQTDDRNVTLSVSASDTTKIKSKSKDFTIPINKTVGTAQTIVYFQRTSYIELSDSAKVRLAYSSESAFSSSVLTVDDAFILKLR